MRLQLRAAGIAVAIGVLGVVIPGTARADLGQCASYELCAWNDVNYQGGVLPKIANGWYNYTGGDNDAASSVYNKIATRDGAFYKDANRKGARMCVNSASGYPYVNNYALGWNDSISSVELFSSEYVC